MKNKINLVNILRIVFLLIITLISVLPFVWSLVSSFKTNREILTSAFSLPKVISLKNYISVFEKTPILNFYLNSLIIAVASTIVVLIVYSMAAYVFARFKFRGSKAMFTILTFSLLVPVTAIIFPVYLMIKNAGLYDTKAGLAFVYTALSLPISLYIMRSYFLTLPKDIENSAYVDGAGFARTYFQIVVPISKPAFGASAVLAFLTSWNDFLYALVLTTGNSARTVPIALKYFTSLLGSNYGDMFAATVVVIFPSVILYVLLQKHIESGLTAGAIKA